MPKLRKNRRIETRWGAKYRAAVKDAVFVTGAPYVPPELPSSVKEHTSEYDITYKCAQCKDCFHFQSSLEDHIARKSWILGYWCQQCFLTICKHSSVEGSLCSKCAQTDCEKRLYLRSRGLRKSTKFGAIRVFYNQCQFLAHLRTHDINLVHMGDLMLMPVPANLDNEWGSEIDAVCEALMEHTFIIKVHIMDWLKNKGIDNNWWQLASAESERTNNTIGSILRGYRGRFYFKPLKIPASERFAVLNAKGDRVSSDIDISNILENLNKRLCASSVNTETSPPDDSAVENEDTPCTIIDIAFVDCGSTSKYFESETSLRTKIEGQTMKPSAKSPRDSFIMLRSSNIPGNHFDRKESTRLKYIPSDAVMSYGNTMITPKRNAKDTAKGSSIAQLKTDAKTSRATAKAVAESNAANTSSEKKSNNGVLDNLLLIKPLSKVQLDAPCPRKANVRESTSAKANRSVHTVTVKSGQPVVTLQSAKQLDVNALINQIPANMVKKKKIVFVGQTSSSTPSRRKQELPSKTVVHLVPDENEKLFEMKKNLENERLSQAKREAGKNDVAKSETEAARSKARSTAGKVVYKNGRKYVIKLASASVKAPKGQCGPTIPVMDKEAQSKSTNGIPALIPLRSTDIESVSHQDRMSSFHGDLSPLTPSPSPSELSSSSSCDVQSRQPSSSAKGSPKPDVPYLLGAGSRDPGNGARGRNKFDESLSFHKGDDQNLYLDVKFLSQKPIYTIVDTPTMITKCREEMLNEFFHLSLAELRKRYAHLQRTGEEISSVMHFVTDNVINENLKAVNILQTVLKHCIDKCAEGTSEKGEGCADEQDAPLNDWEAELSRAEEKNSVCKACEKITKPKYYIPGFSKPAKDDIYCACYRHVCHKCDSYQGNSTRFVAHQTFHDKEKPYLCPDCYRKFSTFKSLEVHTWTTCYHTLKKRVLGCKICEIDGFPDMESVCRHFAIMHSSKKIACDKCCIVLPSYPDYRKHHRERHPQAEDQQPVRLALCKLGRCIVRCEDYMSHMEKHSVVQRLIWYKCPFCSFIHVEADQMRAHLQTGHMSRLKEVMSPDVLWNVLHVESAAKFLKGSSRHLEFTNAQLASCEDGTVMPKIVSARTIPSEVFERGSDDYLINAAAGVQSSSSTPKILDVRSMAKLTLDDPECARTADRKGANSPRAIGEAATGIKLEDGDRFDLKSEVSTEPEIEPEIEPDSPEKRLSPEEGGTMGASGADGHPEEPELVRRATISGPPPLARIPRSVADSDRLKKLRSSSPGKTSPRDRTTESPQRIALNIRWNSRDSLNFSCHLCGERTTAPIPGIGRHFAERHPGECKLSAVTVDLERMSEGFINGGYRELLCQGKRKPDGVASSAPKRRRRWTPKKHSDGKNACLAGLGFCVEQETAEDSEGNFRCKKCGQRCDDMASLREHIASHHRIRGRYLVCLECGDNFVVAPSLQMHLKAFHGIEDPITYMAQNTSYAPDNVDDLDAGGRSIEANQCHVCMAVFEDKATVDKHLRVHGMAFLNRKRIEAQNALRSPEKRSEEPEEEKRTPTRPREPVRKEKPAETILEKISATI